MLSLGGALVLVGTSMLSPYPVPLLGLPAMGVHAQGLASRVGELALQASTSVLNMPNTVVGVLQQVTASPLALLPSVISGGSLLRSGSGLAASVACYHLASNINLRVGGPPAPDAIQTPDYPCSRGGGMSTLSLGTPAEDAVAALADPPEYAPSPPLADLAAPSTSGGVTHENAFLVPPHDALPASFVEATPAPTVEVSYLRNRQLVIVFPVYGVCDARHVANHGVCMATVSDDNNHGQPEPSIEPLVSDRFETFLAQVWFFAVILALVWSFLVLCRVVLKGCTRTVLAVRRVFGRSGEDGDAEDADEVEAGDAEDADEIEAGPVAVPDSANTPPAESAPATNERFLEAINALTRSSNAHCDFWREAHASTIAGQAAILSMLNRIETFNCRVEPVLDRINQSLPKVVGALPTENETSCG